MLKYCEYFRDIYVSYKNFTANISLNTSIRYKSAVNKYYVINKLIC